MSRYEGHTPEPWVVGECKDVGGDWPVTFVHLPHHYEAVIVQSCGTKAAVDLEAQAADARLIADAPLLLRQRNALLEAAKKVLQRWTFDEHQRHTHTWHDMQDCAEAIRAAIADCERSEG